MAKKNNIYIVKTGIFAHCNPLSFAWAGGRLLIVNENQKMIDFGDGRMSKGVFGHHSGKFEHRILGNMEADDTVFKFYDYNIEFDFSLLKNCNWLDKNKAKGKHPYELTISYHLKKFSKKHSI